MKAFTLFWITAVAVAGLIQGQDLRRFDILTANQEERSAWQKGKDAARHIYIEAFETPGVTPDHKSLSDAMDKAAKAAYPNEPGLRGWFNDGVFSELFTNMEGLQSRPYFTGGIQFDFYYSAKIEQTDKGGELVANARGIQISVRVDQSELTDDEFRQAMERIGPSKVESAVDRTIKENNGTFISYPQAKTTTINGLPMLLCTYQAVTETNFYKELIDFQVKGKHYRIVLTCIADKNFDQKRSMINHIRNSIREIEMTKVPRHLPSGPYKAGE
jgi:hypothetical protein